MPTRQDLLTETLTQDVNLNYFSEAVSWEVEARSADADSWRITGKPEAIGTDCQFLVCRPLDLNRRSPVVD